ncbi:MAG: DNRLRE domain-containing protein [Verrucomicrobiota bacterium]
MIYHLVPKPHVMFYKLLRKHIWMNLSVVALVILLTSTSAEAQIAIEASDNAFFRNRFASARNASETLEIRDDGTGQNGRISYLRFDVSSLNPPDIASVTLDLYFSNFNGSVDDPETLFLYALNDGADANFGNSETSWSSTGANALTPNNRPDAGFAELIPNANTTGSLASLSLAGLADETVLSFDIDLASFQTLLTNDTNNEITLMLAGFNGTVSSFASVTNTSGFAVPTLSVTAIPEPSSLALLIVGATGLYFIRRKRS